MAPTFGRQPVAAVRPAGYFASKRTTWLAFPLLTVEADRVGEPMVHDVTLVGCKLDITTFIVFSRTSVGLNSTISAPA
jgi:hypothetical protein